MCADVLDGCFGDFSDDFCSKLFDHGDFRAVPFTLMFSRVKREL